MTLAVREDHNNGYDVQPYQPAPAGVVAAASPLPAGANSLAQWIDNARQLAPVAEYMSRTPFVPKPMQGKPAEVVAAILAGQEMGFGPMASLRMIDVIEGRPGLSAIGLRALVQSHGHDIWVVESTATRAVVKGRRKGSQREETSTWTIDRARQMELLSKSNWKKQPTNMLLARATSEVARLVAADVIGGMPYSSEELADGFDGDQPDGSQSAAAEETAPAKRRAQRKPLDRMEPSSEPAPEPVRAAAVVEPVEPVEPVSAPPAVDGDGITRPQQTKMQILFKEKGIDERGERLAYVASSIGREVGSSSDLSKAEASKVIEDLMGLPDLPQDEPPQDPS